MHAIPVLQLCFLQCRWKTSAVLSSCTTGKDVVLKQILEQLFTSEKVIEEHMVVFSFEKTCEVLHHSLPKLLLSLIGMIKYMITMMFFYVVILGI